MGFSLKKNTDKLMALEHRNFNQTYKEKYNPPSEEVE